VAGATHHLVTTTQQATGCSMTILEAHYDPAIDLGLDFDGL
jgi:hypothetical protein